MRRYIPKPAGQGGAYLLCLEVRSAVNLVAGTLGNISLERGRYVYVGSARRNIEARVARHCRLAGDRAGRVRWHIDYLLIHPAVRVVGIVRHPGAHECSLSKELARRDGTSVPVQRFGASDCRAGCPAHLYKVSARLVKGF